MPRCRHVRPALRGIVTAVLAVVAVLSAGQPPVARADGNQIILAADRYVGARITDGGHLNALSLSIVAPLSGILGAETNFGTTRFSAGTEFVFQLNDAGPLGGGGTFLSTDPAHARITQTGPDVWRIGWDDAYGDGDFDDLFLDVTGSQFRIHAGQQFGVGDPIHAVWPGNLRSDPVNTANGSFVHSATDASLPGAGLPFRSTRTYNSADPSSGPLGPGWSLNVTAAALVQGNGDVIVRAEDGQQLYFSAQGDGTYAGGDGIHSSLTPVPGGGWQLTRKDELAYQFDTAGRVVEVSDHSANQLSFGYDPDGRLVTVTDTAGRVISLAYDAGMLASLTLPDGRTVTYGYSSGRLTSVTDPAGATTTYTYDGTGRLATIVDANGHTQVANTYGSDGRLTDQVDALGHRSTRNWVAVCSGGTTQHQRQLPGFDPGRDSRGMDAVCHVQEAVGKYGGDYAAQIQRRHDCVVPLTEPVSGIRKCGPPLTGSVRDAGDPQERATDPMNESTAAGRVRRSPGQTRPALGRHRAVQPGGADSRRRPLDHHRPGGTPGSGAADRPGRGRLRGAVPVSAPAPAAAPGTAGVRELNPDRRTRHRLLPVAHARGDPGARPEAPLSRPRRPLPVAPAREALGPPGSTAAHPGSHPRCGPGPHRPVPHHCPRA